MNNPMKKLLLLFSGGYDSTLLLHMAKSMGYDVHCLLFDYGQRHVRELETAKRICQEQEVFQRVIKLPDLKLKSQLTSEDTAPYHGVSEWHVPARNLMFLSMAASIAESEGFDLIWYGANYEDRGNRFPDCYQEWVFRLNTVLEINGSRPIQVEAPLVGMTKETIMRLAAAVYQINPEEVHSGYQE